MSIDLTGGYGPELDSVLEKAPDQPDCREGENMWLFDDRGRFGIPRIGVEAISRMWMDRGLQGNVTFPGGRVLNGAGPAPGVDPRDPDGHPRIFGAGPMMLECVEPFRRWKASWHGPMRDTTTIEQLSGVIPERFVHVDLDVVADMVVPPWFQGSMSTEAATLLAGEIEGRFMGGDSTRHEQLFRCTGTIRVGDEPELSFTGTGLRIHRIGIRDVGQFWGHNWQSAVFPSGKAFGLMTFPPRRDGSPSYAEAFVFDGGRMHPARIVDVRWLTAIEPDGADASAVLETKEHGTITIGGRTHGATYSVQGGDAMLGWPGEGHPNPVTFHQGGAHYTWDGERAYGMIERSLSDDQIAR